MKKRFMVVDDSGTPTWTKKVVDKLAKCWKSPTGATVIVNRCEECGDGWHFVCAPSLREVVGGKDDGQELYPRFHLNVGRFVKLFDNPPKVIFDSATGTGHPYVVFVGSIEGEETQIAVVSGPIPNQPSAELAYANGPKAGTVEPKVREEDDDAPDSE